jgi:hypothetical protein
MNTAADNVDSKDLERLVQPDPLPILGSPHPKLLSLP